jgi:two-component system NtrC family response regulator
VTHISRDVERLFFEYNWPGNVRELENVIERAMVMCSGQIITLEDLPKDFRKNASKSAALRMEGIPVKATLYETLAYVEKQIIIKALQQTNFIQSHAADLLGIGKSGLNQKIKKYGIHIPEVPPQV